MSSSSSTFASFIEADIVSLFGQPFLSRMPHRLLHLILAVLVSPEHLQLVILLLLVSTRFFLFEPFFNTALFVLLIQQLSLCTTSACPVHDLMSLVIETDHPCTQLISRRDDVVPWIQVEQPYRSATMGEVKSQRWTM